MAPINSERNKLLDKIAVDQPTVKQLMYAIYWPVFQRAVESDETRRQIIIVNQIRQDPSPVARSIVQSNLDEFVPQFEALMAKATGISRAKLRIPIRLMVATAWGLVSQSIVLDDLATKKSKRTQARIFEHFLDYATAGFMKLVS